MNRDEVQAYISKTGTYSIECPSCFTAKAYPLANLPPGHPNPFSHTCPCGKTLTVRLVGMRHGHRKRARLAASVQRTAGIGGPPVIATVEDISISGVRVATERIRNLQKGEVLNFTCVLDTKARTKLTLPSKVRRITGNESRVILALEYVRLTQDQHALLEAYLAE